MNQQTAEIDEYRRKESTRRLEQLYAEENPFLKTAPRAGPPSTLATAVIDQALRQEAMTQPLMVPATEPSASDSSATRKRKLNGDAAARHRRKNAEPTRNSGATAADGKQRNRMPHP